MLRRQRRSLPRRLVPTLAAAVLLVACDEGREGADAGAWIAGPAASFAASGTPSNPDRVRLRGRAAEDGVTVEVVVAGATTSADLYGFAFDLVLEDPTVAAYVDGSATFGDALTLEGAQQAQVLAVALGNRVTVGVSKLGGGTGNGIGPTEETIVALTFRALHAGTTTVALAGSAFGDPAALDSTGSAIPSVEFDRAPAAIIVF